MRAAIDSRRDEVTKEPEDRSIFGLWLPSHAA
jgi:hypothetical protein